MHYCDCKGTTTLQLLQRVFKRLLTHFFPIKILISSSNHNTIKKHGRLKEAYATYAGGNIEELIGSRVPVRSERATNASDVTDREVERVNIAALTNAIGNLNAVLEEGIGVNMRGEKGLENSLAKRERFRRRMHID